MKYRKNELKYPSHTLTYRAIKSLRPEENPKRTQQLKCAILVLAKVLHIRPLNKPIYNRN